MHYVFAINPNAHKGQGLNYQQQIEDFALTRHLSHTILISRSVDDLRAIASKIEKEDVLVVIGGDGSIHHAINGLNQGATFAVIPFGTGNDFYRMINANRPTDFNQAINGILTGQRHLIDAAQYCCNGETHLFINNISFGLDAYVNAYVCDHMKRSIFPKSFYYPIGALWGVMRYPSYGLTIEGYDDLPRKATLCYIGNGAYYGSGFNPTPWSKLDDGKLDLVVIDALSKTTMLPLINKYRNGNYLDLPQAHVKTIEDLTIHFDTPIIAHADGEPFKTDQIDIHILKSYFNLIMPRKERV